MNILKKLSIHIIISSFLFQFLIAEEATNTQKKASTLLFNELKEIAQTSLKLHESILDAINNEKYKDEINMLIEIYDIQKRNNLRMQQLVTYSLGKIQDEKAIPFLMEIAQNNEKVKQAIA